MGRTFVRQVDQIRNSVAYDDTVVPAATMESSPTNIEDDLNNLRSQVEMLLDATKGGNWFDDAATVNSKKRSVLQLNTDLDDLEEKRILCGVTILTDVTVPTGVAATGSMTTVTGANLVDTETFTLDDGVNPPVVFEFDSGGGITGDVAVTFTGGDTADQVRDAVIAAVDGVGATLLIDASDGGAATVTFTADRQGTAANQTITETVAATGFAVTGMTGGAGDLVVLNDAAGETPTDTAAVDATGLGAVVAVLAGGFATWAPDEVAGANALSPKNLLLIRDAATKDAITSTGGNTIYGLLQAEPGVVQGDAFDDATKQVQISFVENDGSDDLTQVDGVDIGAKVIEYVHAKRVTLDTIPEDCSFPFVTFQDRTALVDVTLDRAIDNQTGPATQTDRNINWRITDTFTLDFEDSTGATDLMSIKPNAAGDEIEMNIDDLDINNVNDVDMLGGLLVDTGGTQIAIGSVAGEITSSGALSLKSTGANDINVISTQEIFFDDVNQTGSTWAQTAGIKLSDTTAEWDAFEVAFGETSLLDAIVQANSSGSQVTKSYHIVTSAIAADADAGGPGTANNLDADLQDYSAIAFENDMNIFLNGVLLRPGADLNADHDYYPGTTTVQLKFEFALVAAPGNPDVITQILNS